MDGMQTLEQIRLHKDTLSLVLLDLMMPGINGIDVLKQAKADPEIKQIPIIVITSDQDAEIESLSLGAIDFIPKPYPQAGVIMARILRTIELSEDRQIINSTERDTLTGLYNREYFYRYAEQFDQHHKDLEMDAIVIDINHFHMINERFGTAYGDEVLRTIAQALRETALSIGGIVCRREADTFMLYCPHGADYDMILDTASKSLSGQNADDNRIWLRMVIYAEVDKALDIERRFDRAKMAADTVQGSFTKRMGIYDNALHEHELYSEQLIEDFQTAIKERQFKVHYQPKFDIRPEIPVLASAEALVRWQHPELGMISPGVFIPLFEDNGLIQSLDIFVWRETAAQIAEWKRLFGFSVPVSVNVSRIDMYDPHLVDVLLTILHENDLSPHELLLEITESAYTQDSGQIIDTVNQLRELGFRVEMDDFGTGYSSLNMISALPIDALKLDMQFIRNAFNERHDTRMIEVIIDIADYLSVPVIAEGVETEEQLIALKEMGCDYVQGYYFSRPVPAGEYAGFITERRDKLGDFPFEHEMAPKGPGLRKESVFGEIAHALSRGFEVIYYVDTDTNHYVEFNSSGKRENLQIQNSGPDFFAAMERVIDSVYAEDRARVALSIKKEALLTQLGGSDPFFMSYRALEDGAPVFYNLKAVRAHTHDDHHIVIGISNVDEQLRQLGDCNESNPVNFSSLAQALSSDLESIYYIDADSNTYLEFKTEAFDDKLKLQLGGIDFFKECQEGIQEVVHPDDREKLSAALDKKTLLSNLSERPVFAMAYRLIVNGEPQHYALKAVWANGPGRRHIVIGVSNVEGHVKGDGAYELPLGDDISYGSIVKALSMNYFSVYYVDADTDRFVEYSSQEGYAELSIEAHGENFFEFSRENIQNVVHPDDIEMVLASFTKENVLAQIAANQVFTLTYRLIIKGKPTYVNLKATRMDNVPGNHIVIGISDIDSQMQREQERVQAMRMANQDATTGVKSKHAYQQDERVIDEAIADGSQGPFAVVVCDVNNLKTVNDTLGHTAGDRYLKEACMIVCHTFTHSPVYRIGGDEFAAILRGSDFDNREQLMEQLNERNKAQITTDRASLACGIAEYQPGVDERVQSVFERADAAMYANKRQLKEA